MGERKRDDIRGQGVVQRLIQVAAEGAAALDSVRAGQLLALDDRLYASLHRVASEMQGALDDGARLTGDELAMLCAAEAKAQCAGNENDPDSAYRDYAHTLFAYSQRLLRAPAV